MRKELAYCSRAGARKKRRLIFSPSSSVRKLFAVALLRQSVAKCTAPSDHLHPLSACRGSQLTDAGFHHGRKQAVVNGPAEDFSPP